MTPPRYSVSPLPSISTHIDVVPRYVSFPETAKAVWRWVSGRPRPTQRERQVEQAVIERLAEELADEDKGNPAQADGGR
jgi:hypothetical protein